MSVIFAPRDLTCELKQKLLANGSGNNSSDEELLLLYNTFGDLIIKALSIVENGSITIERSKSQHQVFRVESNSGGLNYCSSYTRYCRCFNIVEKYIAPIYELWCEHTLAIFLAEIMGRIKVIHLTDEALTRSLEMLYMNNGATATTASSSSTSLKE